MPKVNDKYFEMKKEKIITAALAVCGRKPVYYVTMSDIVEETGLSPGAIYQSFANIEAVFSAIVNKANTERDYISQIDRIVELTEDPLMILRKLCEFSEICFSDMLIWYNKILYELDLYVVYDPEKRSKIYDGVDTPSVYSYLMHKTIEFITSYVNAGVFKPVIPLPELFAFIISSYDGMMRDVILTKCYPQIPEIKPFVEFEEKKLTNALYLSILSLLGVPITKEQSL